MAELLARFRVIDEISDRLDSMAESGQNVVTQFEQAGETASAAFENITGGITTAASSVEGIAVSIDSLQTAAGGASSSADTLAGTLDGYGAAAENAAGATDYWTDAVGNFDKSALEAVYSTEELVEMGFKSAEALQEQEQMFELCAQSANQLSQSIEATAEIEQELSSAMEAASEVTQEIADSEQVSAETKEELANATVAAAEAMNELAAAQEEAAAAMDAYDAVMASGTTDLSELESAAERAGHAAENLAEANANASSATEELSSAAQKAAEEAENGGKKGLDAIESIAGALAAAGITATLKEITEAVYELATEFSEAESTVVLATGATGDALDGLTASMMQAYAASKTGSLNETAAAVGEINTRLGYTGDTLTDTTGMFLDFAAATGGNAASSVRSVTQLMNQWNVPANEMEKTLSKLTYAGQASGISVSTLSQQLVTQKPILDQIGFSLDEAIAMFMKFELAGTNASTVMMGFRTALAKGDISSLDELYEVFDQIASGAITAADAAEMFGSRAGPAIVNAVNIGALSLDDMVSALQETDGTLASTAVTAQTLGQKWSQASNNIKAAFTTAIQPAVNGISSAMAGVVNSIGTFLNEHPAVTKAITAIGIGLGVVVAGIAGVTFVTQVAIPALTAFGVALNAALGPIGWIALAITGVVAAGAALIAMFSGVNDETEGMTAVTRQQYYELQDLNAQYDEACAKYGETSEEASRLRYQIDDLSAAFEQNRQTVEEFVSEVDALCKSVDDVTQSFNNGLNETKANELGSLALIQKFEDLSNQANLTATQEKELVAITKSLAETYPELGISIGNAADNADDYATAMRKACEAEAEKQRQAQAEETYVAALQKQAELADEISKAEANLAAEREAHGMKYDEQLQQWYNGIYTEDSPVAGWVTDLDEYGDALDELNAAQAENEATLARIEEGWNAVAEAQQNALDNASTEAEAVSAAFGSIENELYDLCTAYDSAYQSAYESFSGQFGLFDTAQADMEATVANAQAALDSQLAYWDAYAQNIESLKNFAYEQYGVTQENYEALMSFVQSGSEEAAGLAQSMVENINSGNSEAIAALANTVGEIQAKQSEASAAVADFQTSFSANLQGLETEMQSAIQGMDLSAEASAAAQNTISAYISQLQGAGGSAVTTAQSIAAQIKSVLSGDGAIEATVTFKKESAEVDTYQPEDKEADAVYHLDSSEVDSYKPKDKTATVYYHAVTTGEVPGHARGTTNAENLFVAGENGPELIMRKFDAYANGTTRSASAFIAGDNGPELIVGAQGSTVFPTEETDKLINAINGREERPLNVGADRGEITGRENTSDRVKRILLEIAGSGAIEIGGGVDKETVLEILYEHLKPVLMNIVQSEIFEEGRLSYDY